MNAFDWTVPLPPRPDMTQSSHRFSFNQAALAADLRRLAEALEADTVYAYDVSTTSKVVRDGWTGTVLTMTLSGVHLEKKP